MTDQPTAHHPPRAADGEVSLIVIGVLLLRRRRLIATLALIGGIVGLGVALALPTTYRSTAIFIPQGHEGGTSGIAEAASQFGLRLPASNGGSWGPAVYAELLLSRAILDSVAVDSIHFPEENRSYQISELLGVDAPSGPRRIELTTRALRKRIKVSEEDELGAVRLMVESRWPTMSFQVAQDLVEGVNRFNIHIRKSQAAAERAFVEGQVAEAERALRQAEGRLQGFLQSNRTISGSPELTFTRDRLQRDVMLQQEMHLTWLKSREDARIREVRNTPVITVLEDPRLPAVHESRKIALKTILGFVAGAMLGMAYALLVGWIASLRGTPHPDEREFFELADASVPSFLSRRGRHAANA